MQFVYWTIINRTNTTPKLFFTVITVISERPNYSNFIYDLYIIHT